MNRALRASKRSTILLVILCASAVFQSGCGSGADEQLAPPPGGSPTAVTVTPASLAFGNQRVGTTSAERTVTISNTGSNAFAVSNASATGPFTISGFSAGSNLTAGQSLALGIRFVPGSEGSLTGTLTITYSAASGLANSNVSLSGTGTATTVGQQCTGSATSQVQQDVTASISSKAAGVSIVRLTNSGSNANTYVDIPAYSAPSDRILVNHGGSGIPSQMMVLNPDGSNPQLIGNTAAQQAYLTADGTFAYYTRPNPSGPAGSTAIFRVDLTAAGNCQEAQVTSDALSDQLIPAAPNPVIQVSTASKLPDGRNVIAVAPGRGIARVVVEDGTQLDLIFVDPPDPYQGQNYHRIRLNPRFPQWIAYKRNQSGSTGGTPEMWLYNFDTGALHSLQLSTLAGDATTVKVGHMGWSRDGLRFGHTNPDIGNWNVIDVFNADGTLKLDASNNFTSTTIGPSQAELNTLNANYCNWALDDSFFVCTSGFATGLKVYLMDFTGQTKFLTATDAQALNDFGTPRAQFIIDKQHIIFNSDRDGTPQTYIVEGFTTTIP